MGYPWVGHRVIDEGAGNASRGRVAGPSITSGKTATIAAFRVLLIRRRPETNQTQHRAEIRGPPRGNHTGRADRAPRPAVERAPSVRARSPLTVRRGWCKPGAGRYLRATSRNAGGVFAGFTWASSKMMIVRSRNPAKPAGMMITRPAGARSRCGHNFQNDQDYLIVSPDRFAYGSAYGLRPPSGTIGCTPSDGIAREYEPERVSSSGH
jgi:hypothetical protein